MTSCRAATPSRLELVVATSEDLSDGDRVTNEACVNGVNANFASTAEVDDANAVCSTERTRIVEPTATPTATNTPLPTFTPRPPLPTAQPQPTIAPPVTGTGGNSGGTNWTALGFGLGALSLMLGFSAVLARKRIRIRR